MDATTRARLVAEYVERYAKRFIWGKDGVLRQNDINFAVFEEFDRRAHHDPETCWSLILGVLVATDDARAVARQRRGATF